MYNLAYSIIMTLLHSLWQMAILLVLYYTIVSLFTKWPPLAKRNLLLSAVAVQLLVSLVSFFIIFSGQKENLLYSDLNLSWLSPATGIPQQWFVYLFIIYMAGMLYKLLGSYFKWQHHTSFLKTDLQKAPAELRAFTTQKAIAFGIKRKVEIWFSDNIHSPLTYGFFKPVILFPVALCSRLSISQAEALIVHELTHIRTKDYFFNWLLVIGDAIYFFNPFVKIAAKQIRLEREKNCDATVINFKYPAINYAEALLQVARYSADRHSMAIAAVSDKNELLKRIQFFSAQTAASKDRQPVWPAASLMLGFLLLVSLAVINVKKQIKSEGMSYNGPIVLHTGFEERHTADGSFAVLTTPVDPAQELSSREENTDPIAYQTAESEVNSPEADGAEIAAPLTAVQTIDLHPANANIIHQAAFTAETPAPPPVVKEMIVTEENSKGEMITKSFTVTLENGEWKIQPQWMYTERAITDSLKAAIKLDSTIYRVFPTIQ